MVIDSPFARSSHLSGVDSNDRRIHSCCSTLSSGPCSVEALQELQKKFGNEVPRFNGDVSWELPMPGTFIVSKDGIARLASVDSDYRRRLEPGAILDCLANLS
jgi:hypothetical protein